MSDKLSKLLPCPFCGGRASSSQQTTGGRWAAYCLNCEAMVDGEFSEPDAIAAWNRRASPAPAISESEDAVKLERSIEQWRKCDPELMSRQSPAAIFYALEDAKHDILALDAARKGEKS
ncbi:Lar family restriction alleviation protein [Burkholderia gladioli]|uniref:Lar family restriction alleviation protein n=1 Tax=Burkholderia gladioli TaxID=28095 RepID=UPI00163F0ED5|nr:Lar family restriction alleviation protein [Burkholderia gladioli]